jgi:hypothetical protein
MRGNPPATAENREKRGFSAYFERGAVTLHQEMSGIHSSAGAAKGTIETPDPQPVVEQPHDNL